MKKEKSKAVEAAGQTEPAAPGEFKMIKRTLIRPDPDQPRKTFNEAALEELAESIRQQGIIQPLAVEFVPAEFRIEPPDLINPEEWWVRSDRNPSMERGFLAEGPALNYATADGHGLENTYRIITGERRWRAAALAGLEELPCMVRTVTAKDRFSWQFIENKQRENVNALEEAEALQGQLGARQKADPKFSPEKLAAELGMSRAALYERLKLTRLSVRVKEALLAGKISTSVAGVVATLPLPSQQDAILKIIVNEEHFNFPWSVRKVQEALVEKYLRQLDDAPFDRNRDNFQGVTVGGACKGCPHRTGNMLNEFPDLKTRPNVCTDPECFTAKCQAHHLEAAQKLEAKGHVVTTMKALYADPVEHIASDKLIRLRSGLGSPKELLGKHAPKAVIAVDEDGLHEFYTEEQWKAAAKKAGLELPEERGVPAAGKTPAEYKAEEEKRLADARATEEKRERVLAFVLTLLPALAKGLERIKDAVAWRIAKTQLDSYDDYTLMDDYLKILVKGAKSEKAQVLGRLLSSEAPVNRDGTWNKDLSKLWLLAGVDAKAAWDKHEKEAQRALALPTKKKLEQGRLVKVLKMDKAGIARLKAAQEARWAKIKAGKAA